MSEDMNRFILDKLEKVDDKIEEVRVNYARLASQLDSHEKIDNEIHETVKHMSSHMSKQMQDMCTSLDQYNQLLQDHIKRTNIAEENIKSIKEAVAPIIKNHRIDEEVQRRYDELAEQRSKKYKRLTIRLGVVSVTIGIISGILKLLGIF